jgi:hypothetical protein
MHYATQIILVGREEIVVLQTISSEGIGKKLEDGDYLRPTPFL